MKHFFTLAGAAMLFTSARGQTYYESQRQNREYRSLQEATRRAYAVPDRPSSGSSARSSYSGSGSSNSRPVEKFVSPLGGAPSTSWTAADEANLKRLTAEGEVRIAEAKAWNAAKALREKEYINQNAINQRDRRLAFYQQAKAAAGDSVLNYLDVEERMAEEYWALNNNKKPIDFTEALYAATQFWKDTARGTFEHLSSLAFKARPYPMAATQCYRALLRKFPQQREAIEKDRLRAYTYHFGGLRPNIVYGHRGDLNFHPWTVGENKSKAAYINLVLDDFMRLARKYPTEALVAAGFCRVYLNPFLLQAKRCTNDSCREEMYMNVLYTPRARLNVDFAGDEIYLNSYGPGSWENASTQQLQEAGDWLSANRYELLKTFTREDWQAIAIAQNLNLPTVAYYFRDRKFPAPQVDHGHLKELKAALKDARKQ